MSVLAILVHLGRAIVDAHNNAKVRNLMDTLPPRAHPEAGKEGPGKHESHGRHDTPPR